MTNDFDESSTKNQNLSSFKEEVASHASDKSYPSNPSRHSSHSHTKTNRKSLPSGKSSNIDQGFQKKMTFKERREDAVIARVSTKTKIGLRNSLG